jgi:hypothetical protein
MDLKYEDYQKGFLDLDDPLMDEAIEAQVINLDKKKDLGEKWKTTIADRERNLYDSLFYIYYCKITESG